MAQHREKRKRPRRQIMLDQAVQGALVARIGCYWLLCIAAVSGGSLGWAFWSNHPPPGESWLSFSVAQVLPGLVVSLSLLPLVIWDALQFSNRFVAPIHALRNSMKRKSYGDPLPVLEVRKKDFWQDIVRWYNATSVEQTRRNPE